MGKTTGAIRGKSKARTTRGKNARRNRRTISQINGWISSNHQQLLDAAKRNCIRLTGKSTFGSSSRRKSA